VTWERLPPACLTSDVLIWIHLLGFHFAIWTTPSFSPQKIDTTYDAPTQRVSGGMPNLNNTWPLGRSLRLAASITPDTATASLIVVTPGRSSRQAGWAVAPFILKSCVFNRRCRTGVRIGFLAQVGHHRSLTPVTMALTSRVRSKRPITRAAIACRVARPINTFPMIL
jgi:hypothetical protein